MAMIIRRRDINQSVGKLRYDQSIVDMSWSFRPSIGIVARDVDRFGIAVQNQRTPLVRAVRDVMQPSIRKNFRMHGRPKWQPLAPFTLQQKGLAGVAGGDNPLISSGKLEKGATSFRIWTITENSATVKSLPQSIWYGAVHQEGYGSFGPFMAAAKKSLGSGANFRDVVRHAFNLMDDTRGGKQKHRKIVIPQRRFIMFQEDDLDDIQEIFADWLEHEARRVGRFGVGLGGV
jgi:phage gpG-like protein